MGARSVVRQALGRTAVLLVWALVGWGVLLVASAVANAFTEGGGSAFSRLLPARGASIWGWLGPFSVLLALGAVLAVAALAIARAMARGHEPRALGRLRQRPGRSCPYLQGCWTADGQVGHGTNATNSMTAWTEHRGDIPSPLGPRGDLTNDRKVISY